MKTAVIMPTYNEASNIGVMIEELFETVFPGTPGMEMYLVVVDDDSPDGTGDVVRLKMPRFPNLHLLSGKKAGLGAAYLRGMTYSMEHLRADALIEMDADFQHSPVCIIDMAAEFDQGADVIIGSRYVKGSSVSPSWGFWRHTGSRCVNRLARILLGCQAPKDLTSGFRMTRVSGVLSEISLEDLLGIHRFAYKLDLLQRIISLSNKTVEIPFLFSERVRERTKFSIWEAAAILRVLLHLWVRQACRPVP